MPSISIAVTSTCYPNPPKTQKSEVLKRYLIAAVARNLGLVMRKQFGIGTPSGLQAAGGLSVFVRLVCFHIYDRLHRRRGVLESSRVDLELCATTA